MAQLRTPAALPSNADRLLDIEVALEVLEEERFDILAYYATCWSAERMWNDATNRAVAILARPGDPSDELEALYALTCTRKH